MGDPVQTELNPGAQVDQSGSAGKADQTGQTGQTGGQSGSEATPPEHTEVEQLAIEMGWNPDKEIVGDGFVDAKTYIRRTREIQQSQSKTIREQNRKLDRVAGTVQSIELHFQKVAENQQREFDRQIADLKKERREAIAENDPAKVDELDTQIDKLKEDKIKAAQTPRVTSDQPDGILADWMDANEWYESNPEMTKFANARARLYRITEIRDDTLYAQVLDEIARETKEKFPNSKTVKRSPPPAGGVEGPTTTGRQTTSEKSGTKTYTRANLDEQHRKVYDEFVGMGLDGKKLIEDWVKIGELS